MNRPTRRILIASPFLIAVGGWLVAGVLSSLIFPAIIMVVALAAWITWAVISILDGEW